MSIDGSINASAPTDEELQPAAAGPHALTSAFDVDVQFAPTLDRWHWWKTPRNTYKLFGRGTLAFTPDTVQIKGKARGYFAIPTSRTIDIPIIDIRNVERVDDAVGFDFVIVQGTGKNGTVALWLNSSDHAEKLYRALPERRDEPFIAKFAEAQAFERALHEQTPRLAVVPAIAAFNTGLFVLMALLGAGWLVPDGSFYFNWGSNYGPLTLQGQEYRWFTATFLHFGLMHLLLNMWALLDVGSVAERIYGSARFALIYIFAGITGSMLSTAWDPLRNSAGASGAIFGVFGALGAFWLLQRKNLPPSQLKARATSTVVFAGYSLLNGAVHPAIDNAAHVGGLLGGFLVALPLVRPIPSGLFSPRHWNLKWIGAGFGALAIIVSGFLFVPTHHRGDPSVLVYSQVMHGFGAEESRTMRRFFDIAPAARSKASIDPQLAPVIGQEILPFWQDAATRLEPLEPPRDLLLRREFLTVRRIVLHRRNAFQMIRDGAAEGDRAMITEGLRLHDESTEWTEAFVREQAERRRR
jgi:rhomboid protease GluP